MHRPLTLPAVFALSFLLNTACDVSVAPAPPSDATRTPSARSGVNQNTVNQPGQSDEIDEADSGGASTEGTNAVDPDSPEGQITSFLNGHTLTEIRSSSNFDPLSGIALLQSFRGDLKLCSTGRFAYEELEEITVGPNVTRNEFSATGTWVIRVDIASNQAFLDLNFEAVSKGDPFKSSGGLSIDANGAVFLGDTRMFRTDNDDLCN